MKKKNQKIKCLNCNWIGPKSQLKYSDKLDDDVCPKCGSAELVPLKNE